MPSIAKTQKSGSLQFSLNKIEEDKAEVQDAKNNIALPYLQSSLFGTILEDTVTQLRILMESGSEIKIIKTQSDWKYLQRKKYDVKESAFVDELDGIDPKNLGSNEYKINKLDTDRKFITDIILSTYVDLCLNKSFSPLTECVTALLNKDRYRLSLAEDDAKNKVLRRELARQLRQLRNHVKSVIYDADAKINGLKTQVEDSFLNSECKDRYVVNWQRARTEQHIQTIQDAEIIYSDKAEYFKVRTDHEHRVHIEAEQIINFVINETLEKVENMMSKYDKDIEAIDLLIQIRKNEYDVMKDKRIELEILNEDHDKLMKDWIYFKDEREKARLYREKMNASAVTVQAWWRGLLVRRQLGPYKVAKKPKGAADAKK